MAASSGETDDTRPAHVLLPYGTPIVAVRTMVGLRWSLRRADDSQQHALVDKIMHFPCPLGDPIKQHFMFNVAVGSFYFSRYGHPGVGVPLQVIVSLLRIMSNVADIPALWVCSADPELAGIDPTLMEALSALVWLTRSDILCGWRDSVKSYSGAHSGLRGRLRMVSGHTTFSIRGRCEYFVIII